MSPISCLIDRAAAAVVSRRHRIRRRHRMTASAHRKSFIFYLLALAAFGSIAILAGPAAPLLASESAGPLAPTSLRCE